MRQVIAGVPACKRGSNSRGQRKALEVDLPGCLELMQIIKVIAHRAVSQPWYR